MSQSYSRAVMAKGDVVSVYDKMSEELVKRGFTITDANKPYTLVADRGTLRPSRRIQKHSHTLVLAIRPMDGGIALSFVYVMGDFWDFTPGDRTFFDNEINSIAQDLALSQGSAGAPSPSSYVYIEEIEKLARLKESGILSMEEFDRKKRMLLGL